MCEVDDGRSQAAEDSGRVSVYIGLELIKQQLEEAQRLMKQFLARSNAGLDFNAGFFDTTSLNRLTASTAIRSRSSAFRPRWLKARLLAAIKSVFLRLIVRGVRGLLRGYQCGGRGGHE